MTTNRYGIVSAYANQIVQGRMCVWLQNYGWCPAKLGKDLKVGDVIVYNFGSTAEIVKVSRESKNTIWFIVKYEGDRFYEQKILKTTYKPVKGA
jgi:hypothetical protein